MEKHNAGLRQAVNAGPEAEAFVRELADYALQLEAQLEGPGKPEARTRARTPRLRPVARPGPLQALQPATRTQRVSRLLGL